MFKGTLEEAKAAALEQSRWLVSLLFRESEELE